MSTSRETEFIDQWGWLPPANALLLTLEAWAEIARIRDSQHWGVDLVYVRVAVESRMKVIGIGEQGVDVNS